MLLVNSFPWQAVFQNVFLSVFAVRKTNSGAQPHINSRMLQIFIIIIVRKCSCIYLSLVHFNTIFFFLFLLKFLGSKTFPHFSQNWISTNLKVKNDVDLILCKWSEPTTMCTIVYGKWEMQWMQLLPFVKWFLILLYFGLRAIQERELKMLYDLQKWNEINKRSNIGTLSNNPPTNQFTLCRLLTHSFACSLHFPSTFCIIYYSEDITASCFEFS